MHIVALLRKNTRAVKLMYFYADILILINTIMNTIILFLTAWAAGILGKTWRILAAAFVGSIYALGGLLAADSLLYTPPAKLAAAGGLVWLAFGPRPWRVLLLYTAYFYIVSLLLGGAVLGWLLLASEAGPGTAWQTVTWRHLAAGGLISLLFIGVVWRRLTAGMARQPLLFPLVLGWQGREVRLTALLDTGNQLYTMDGRRPIVLVERQGLEPLLGSRVNEYLCQTPPGYWLANLDQCADPGWLARVQIIPCQSVGGAGMLLGFRPDRMTILTTAGANTADAVIGIHSGRLSATGSYAALLHPAVMRELDGKEGREICA